MEKRVLANKKAQGLSTNAIILIILGVVILVILILGFTLGWERIAPFIQSSNNVEQLAQSCSVACLTGAQVDFCSIPRELKIPSELETDEFVNGESYTCEVLSQGNFGIDTCPDITCEN